MVTKYLPVVAQTCSHRDCPEMEKLGIHKHQTECNYMILRKLYILRIRRLGVRVPSGVPFLKPCNSKGYRVFHGLIPGMLNVVPMQEKAGFNTFYCRKCCGENS
jgi:hypothetical protein